MKFIRLNKDCFFRQYNDIGYIFNQSTRKDLIVDGIGAIFLSLINRAPTLTGSIINELCSKFPQASINEINNDFVEFTNKLGLDNFIITGDNTKELDAKEKSLNENYSSIRANLNETKEIQESKYFLNKYFQKHPKIFRAHIELLNSCNLKCVHCYLSPHDKKLKITKQQLFSFLDELEIMGTLEVIITGGEALLYKDLIQVLKYAREKDFSIALLTNGTLFNDEIIESLREVNVAFVQVSLYSMNPTLHDKITGVSGSWNKTQDSIHKLIKNNIRIEIACPVINENSDSFHKVLDYYNNLGVNVSNDLGIMAGEDFSRDNLSHRVNKNEIREIIKRRTQFEIFPKSLSNLQRNCSPDDSICSMGKSLICFSYDGNYYPCPGFRMSLGNIYDNSLNKLWKSSPKINYLRNISYSSFPTCLKCEYVEYCSICPAKFYNESSGDIFKTDKYFCEITKMEVNTCKH